MRLSSERNNDPGHRFSDDPVVSTAAAIKAGNDSDDQEFEDREPGAISGNLRDRIKAGEAIKVRAESSGGRQQPSRSHMAVFNPGHVVAVIEGLQRPRGWR